jgi:RNA polymerase sigma factor (sigma-70 family)
MANNSDFDVSDEALIRSLASGDSKAIQYIYRNTYQTIEKMVFKMNGSTDDAYDVFQDSMTILYEKAKGGQLELSCKLSTYLTAIAKHLWLKRLSKRKRQSFSVIHENTPEPVSVDTDINRFFEFENNVERLKQCFEEIGEPCKGILESFYVHNKSMQEIAADFGYTNPDNAKTQKYKCMNRLRKLFYNQKVDIIDERR